LKVISMTVLERNRCNMIISGRIVENLEKQNAFLRMNDQRMCKEVVRLQEELEQKTELVELLNCGLKACNDEWFKLANDINNTLREREEKIEHLEKMFEKSLMHNDNQRLELKRLNELEVNQKATITSLECQVGWYEGIADGKDLVISKLKRDLELEKEANYGLKLERASYKKRLLDDIKGITWE
jgi:predicted RNase H-like nuclease (RuvC/YqgF family)